MSVTSSAPLLVRNWINIAAVFLLLLAFNGSTILNVDGWRYSGSAFGAPTMAPVMLAIFNGPTYKLLGVWGEVILQCLILAYAIARVTSLLKLHIPFWLAAVWMLTTVYAFFAITFVVDAWTPIVLILVFVIASQPRINILDWALLFLAAGVHNVHWIIGAAAAIGALILGLTLNWKRVFGLLVCVILTVPTNKLLADHFHRYDYQKLSFAFIASDLLMSNDKVLTTFCSTEQQNVLCEKPYTDHINGNREKGSHDILWGARSIITSAGGLGDKHLTYQQYEDASRELVVYSAYSYPHFYIINGLQGVWDMVLASPLQEFGWPSWAETILKTFAPYKYMEPHFEEVLNSAQAKKTWENPLLVNLSTKAVFVFYLLFVTSFLIAISRRDSFGIRCHLFFLIVFVGAAFTYSALSIMYPRYYFRSLFILGIPMLLQVNQLRSTDNGRNPFNRNKASRTETPA